MRRSEQITTYIVHITEGESTLLVGHNRCKPSHMIEVLQLLSLMLADGFWAVASVLDEDGFELSRLVAKDGDIVPEPTTKRPRSA